MKKKKIPLVHLISPALKCTIINNLGSVTYDFFLILKV